MASLRLYDAHLIESAISWRAAVAALRAVLVNGLDPEAEPARGVSVFGAGELLTMPSSGQRCAGVKLATVASANPAAGLPRIQGLYVLFDAATLTPSAVLDGAALTALRTPAVSALAVDLIASPDVKRLLVFGTGPQALGHIHALSSVRPIESVGVVGRTAGRTTDFVELLGAQGFKAWVAGPDDVSSAEVIACCTTAQHPVFDGRLLATEAVVVACGSHRPDHREVDAETVRKCGGAIVESVPAALAEAGDVVQAIAEDAITASDLVGLAELVRGTERRRPRLVKTVGMGWEDLTIAAAVVGAIDADEPPDRV